MNWFDSTICTFSDVMENPGCCLLIVFVIVLVFFANFHRASLDVDCWEQLVKGDHQCQQK